jgi:hypothetical protein
MKHHPIESAAVGAVILVRVLRSAVVPLVALVLTVAGWQPGQTAQPQPLSMPAATVPTVDRLTVAQLRILARQAGHRALARSGRRADLLAALAG